MSLTRPWIQLYTRDWLDNKELRIRCSPLARSVLIDLMCLASEGARHGYLEDRLGPLTESYLAARCHVTVKQLRAALGELEKSERVHKDGSAYFIRRMVEDERIRQSRAAGGHKGGNPKLKGKDNLSINHYEDRKVIHPFDSDFVSEDEFELESEEEKIQESSEAKKLESLQEQWFAKIWENFWRKTDRPKCLKEFRKHVRNERERDLVAAAVQAQMAYYLGREIDARPYFSTWLNGERYLENPEDGPERIQVLKNKGLSVEEIANL